MKVTSYSKFREPGHVTQFINKNIDRLEPISVVLKDDYYILFYFYNNSETTNNILP